LNKIKAAPPFLGIEHSQYVLSPETEKVLIEHFTAIDFKKENQGIIRGRKSYRAIKGDDPKKVAKKVYGKTKFASRIGIFSFSNGSYYTLPYIDISETLNLSPEYITDQYSKAEYVYIQPMLKELIGQYNLIDAEALSLIEMVYEAAKRTRSEGV
jgi:hypothetical protein